MGSAEQPERSLGGGISLPQWMKSKVDIRFDFDDSTFSPPSYDDSFFYVRYSKTEESSAKPSQDEFRPIGKVLDDNKTTTASNQVTSSQPTPPDFKEVGKVDFSKHPLPCQPFVPNAAQKVPEPKPSKSAFGGKVKSQGVDDGFHGQPALCGKSIVQVANQMMSGKVTKGFSLETTQISDSAEYISKNGSKSLPASPIASPMSTPDNSPKSRRKLIHSNRYFTGPYKGPDKEKYQGGWILASLLGQQREIVAAKIEEEDENEEVVAASKNLNRKKSISSQNLTYIPKEDLAAAPVPQLHNRHVYTNVFQAKPSELREMNFWSPTSM